MRKILTVFVFLGLFSLTMTAGDKVDNGRQWHVTRDKMPHFENFWSSLSATEKSDLRKLQAEDETKFRKRISAKMHEYKKSLKSSDSTTKKMVKQYKNSNSKKQKTAIVKQLRDQTEKEFYKNLEARKNQLSNLEQRLRKLRKNYAEREKHAKLIIDTRVKNLLKAKHRSRK